MYLYMHEHRCIQDKDGHLISVCVCVCVCVCVGVCPCGE